MKANNKNKNWIAKIKIDKNATKHKRKLCSPIQESRVNIMGDLILMLKVTDSIHAIASSTPPKPKPKPSIENTTDTDNEIIK